MAGFVDDQAQLSGSDSGDGQEVEDREELSNLFAGSDGEATESVDNHRALNNERERSDDAATEQAVRAVRDRARQAREAREAREAAATSSRQARRPGSRAPNLFNSDSEGDSDGDGGAVEGGLNPGAAPPRAAPPRAAPPRAAPPRAAAAPGAAASGAAAPRAPAPRAPAPRSAAAASGAAASDGPDGLADGLADGPDGLADGPPDDDEVEALVAPHVSALKQQAELVYGTCDFNREDHPEQGPGARLSLSDMQSVTQLDAVAMDLEDERGKALLAVSELWYQTCARRRLKMDSEEGKDLRKRMGAAVDAVAGPAHQMAFYSKVMRVSARLVWEAQNNNLMGRGAVLGGEDELVKQLPCYSRYEDRQFVETLAEKNERLSLVMYLRFEFHAQQLRTEEARDAEEAGVFAPVLSPEGHNTITFKRIGTRSKWVREMCSLSRNMRMWARTQGMHTTDMVPMMCKRMGEQPDGFPLLLKRKTLQAWSNGLYDLETLEFHPYPLSPQRLRGEEACCKYFEQEFPVQLWRDTRDGFDTAARGDPAHWTSIALAPVERIWRQQKKMELQDGDGLTEYDVFIISYGRCLHWVEDDKQFTFVIKGETGTGKTVMIDMLSGNYETQDVAQMSGNGKQKFQMSDWLGKLLLVCQEMTNAMTLEASEALKVFEGQQGIAVNEYCRNSSLVEFKTPVMMVGNEMFAAKGREEHLGFKRRLVTSEFDHPMPASARDDSIKRDIEEVRGAVTIKSSFAYRDFLRMRRGIWEVVPRSMIETNDRLFENRFERFLKNDKMLQIDARRPAPRGESVGFTRVKDLSKRYKQWLDEEGHGSHGVVASKDNYKGEIARVGLGMAVVQVRNIAAQAELKTLRAMGLTRSMDFAVRGVRLHPDWMLGDTYQDAFPGEAGEAEESEEDERGPEDGEDGAVGAVGTSGGRRRKRVRDDVWDGAGTSGGAKRRCRGGAVEGDFDASDLEEQG